jgi:hypothetical protein
LSGWEDFEHEFAVRAPGQIDSPAVPDLIDPMRDTDWDVVGTPPSHWGNSRA